MNIYNLTISEIPYTFEAPSNEIAAAVVFLLGNGHYGAKSEDKSFEIPATGFLGMRGTEWFLSTFQKDLKQFIEENKIEIANSLTTFIPGTPTDRKTFFEKLDNTPSLLTRIAIIDQTLKNKGGKDGYIPSLGWHIAQQLI